MMRRPRDYDAELKALDAKAKELKERKLRQFGVLGHRRRCTAGRGTCRYAAAYGRRQGTAERRVPAARRAVLSADTFPSMLWLHHPNFRSGAT